MSEKQKTVMLHLNSLHKGGAERVFVQLAERFAACGYRSILVTSFAKSDREEYTVSDRVEHYVIEPELVVQSRLKRNFTRIRALRRLCKSCRPDILLSCMQEQNFRAMLAAAGLPVKRLVSVCNVPDMEYPGLPGFIVGKLLMPAADGCVFQTEEEKVWFPERLQRKSRIIMNQVNESFFEVRHSGERHDFVTVGRLTAQKNQAMLIRAFASIADETEERLLLYGDGELRGELQALIDSLGLGGRALLMGSCRDVANAVKDARAFVLPSDYEGLPNALLEAMALGLPCISTDCRGGGPAMVLQDGVNGLLTPIGDEAALAAAMRRVLEDPEGAERMGEAARETAEAFRPEKVFALWKAYVDDLLA